MLRKERVMTKLVNHVRNRLD
jgi:hypothetical protein